MVFPHLLTTKVRENQPWIRRYLYGELQVAATAAKGEILDKVSFLVSRLLKSGKKGPSSQDCVGGMPKVRFAVDIC